MTLATYPREVSGTYTLKECEGCGVRRTLPRCQRYCPACLNPPQKKTKSKAKVEPREDKRIKRILSLPGLKRVMETEEINVPLLREQLRLGTGYAYDLENNKVMASPATAQALAEVLCTSVEELQRAS